LKKTADTADVRLSRVTTPWGVARSSRSPSRFSMVKAWKVGLWTPSSFTRPNPPWNGPIPAPPSSNTSVKVQYEIESASVAHWRYERVMAVAAKTVSWMKSRDDGDVDHSVMWISASGYGLSCTISRSRVRSSKVASAY